MESLTELISRARKLDKEKSFHESSAIYSEVLSRSPCDDSLRLAAARSFIGAKQFDKADEHLRIIIETNKDPGMLAKAYTLLATSSTRVSGHANSKDRWLDALRHNPNNRAVIMQTARSLLGASDNDQALSLYTKLKEVHDGIGEIYEGLAFCIHRIDPSRKTETLDCLYQALELYDSKSGRYLNLAYFFLELAISRLDSPAVREMTETIENTLKSLGLLRFWPYFQLYRTKAIRTEAPLSDVHDYSWSEADCAQLTSLVISCMRESKALSLIRLGDGEARVLSGESLSLLGATGSPSERLTPDLSSEEFSVVLSRLEIAIRNTDYLGLPSPQLVMRSKQWQKLIETLPFESADDIFRGRTITNWHCHNHLYWSLGLEEIVKAAHFVGYISPHALDDYFYGLGASHVQGHIIPGERWNQKLNLNALQEPHYPNAYNRILKSLAVPYPGALFLVGAGVLGKIYCDEIKQRGGIAIDLGAVFDHVAGHPNTRITYKYRANRGMLSLGSH